MPIPNFEDHGPTTMTHPVRSSWQAPPRPASPSALQTGSFNRTNGENPPGPTTYAQATACCRGRGSGSAAPDSNADWPTPTSGAAWFSATFHVKHPTGTHSARERCRFGARGPDHVSRETLRPSDTMIDGRHSNRPRRQHWPGKFHVKHAGPDERF